MISIRCILTALTALTALTVLPAAVHGDVPSKRNINYYSRLWADSPFTIKPVAKEDPGFNPLDDYALLGVSPIKGGYRVTMTNKKKPSDASVVVESGKPADGFAIVEVIHEPGMPLATKVRMSSAGKTGLVVFEEKFLKISAPKPVVNKGNANANKAALENKAKPNPAKLPARPRIINRPPGLPNDNNNSTPTNRSQLRR